MEPSWKSISGRPFLIALMPEFLLLVRNEILKDCEAYVLKLKQSGKLIASQLLVKEGMIISLSDDGWNIRPMRGKGEVQVGYYHVLADSIDEAIEMAKGNPEFVHGARARIEVRPVQVAEKDTGFVYPR